MPGYSRNVWAGCLQPACGLVFGFAQMRGMTAEVMVPAGIATRFLFQSLQSLVQYLAAPEVLQEIVFWLFGSMLKASWRSVTVAGTILIIALGILVPDGWRLTALLGPNGTGKSTFLKGIAGLIPARGSVSVNARQLTPQQRGRSIAYMPQDIGPSSSLTIMAVVLLGRLRSLGLHVPRDLQRLAETAIAQFGLESLETRTLDAVSGGQRQMVYPAQTLFRQPDVLLPDQRRLSTSDISSSFLARSEDTAARTA